MSGLIGTAAFTVLSAPAAPARATWSMQTPGTLEVAGKPLVRIETVDGLLVAKVTVSGARTQVYRTTIDATTERVHTFWRGDRVIIDGGEGNVVAIDPVAAMMRSVPDSFGWRRS